MRIAFIAILYALALIFALAIGYIGSTVFNDLRNPSVSKSPATATPRPPDQQAIGVAVEYCNFLERYGFLWSKLKEFNFEEYAPDMEREETYYRVETYFQAQRFRDLIIKSMKESGQDTAKASQELASEFAFVTKSRPRASEPLLASLVARREYMAEYLSKACPNNAYTAYIESFRSSQ